MDKELPMLSVRKAKALTPTGVKKVTPVKHIAANQNLVTEAGKSHFQDNQIWLDQALAGVT